MALVAKPIVKNVRWIVTDGSQKVGNLEADGGEYTLAIRGKQYKFTNTNEIKRRVEIEFQRPAPAVSKRLPPFAIWPTAGKTYNNMFDVRRKLHVYTKTAASRCYYAAGWFRLKLSDGWETVFCPKYIFIQRYPYEGPFSTQAEADGNK